MQRDIKEGLRKEKVCLRKEVLLFQHREDKGKQKFETFFLVEKESENQIKIK